MSAAPTDSDQVHEAVSRQLRAAGQRYTASRRRLVELLANAGSPLSIVEVLGRAPGLPQSSLYRNLATLEQAGVVVRVGTGDDFARYELAEPSATITTIWCAPRAGGSATSRCRPVSRRCSTTPSAGPRSPAVSSPPPTASTSSASAKTAIAAPPIRYVRSLADLGGLRVSVRQAAVAASALLLASSAAAVVREHRDTDVLRGSTR